MLQEADLGPPERAFLAMNPFSLVREDSEASGEIEAGLESLVTFYFNNWLHFSKARPFFAVVWDDYAKFKAPRRPRGTGKAAAAVPGRGTSGPEAVHRREGLKIQEQVWTCG